MDADLRPRPPIPTIPTVLPGPVPFLFNGENTVRPAHNSGAACSDFSASGMANTHRS